MDEKQKYHYCYITMHKYLPPPLSQTLVEHEVGGGRIFQTTDKVGRRFLWDSVTLSFMFIYFSTGNLFLLIAACRA